MFDASVYIKRRTRLLNALRKEGAKGLALFPGNGESPMNGPENCRPFRQDGTFLYLTGISRPDLFLTMDIDDGRTVLFGEESTDMDAVWTGKKPTIAEEAEKTGVVCVAPLNDVYSLIDEYIAAGNSLHYLPMYRAKTALWAAYILNKPLEDMEEGFSEPLIRCMVKLRSVKEDVEIVEMENAANIMNHVYAALVRSIAPGVHETFLKGVILGEIAKVSGQPSFQPIVTVRGEILHNPDCVNRLSEGDLLLVDAGAETPMGYASDFTRTYPVNGKFSPEQKNIYELVLKTQETAVSLMKPGVSYRDVHLKAAGVIAGGLMDMGLMKGNVEEAVASGAHALFFPHGLGHLIGLEAHDMESYGEDYVGYDDTVMRSKQFGFSSLRFAKVLKEGHALTVEPGIYFNPALIHRWFAEKKHEDFINYKAVNKFKGFGGVRIEDDVVIEKNGARILGKPLEKSVESIESLMSKT